MPKLKNDRHEEFLNEYVNNGYRGGPAYRVVNPDATIRTSEVEASKLLRRPEVQERKEELRKERLKRLAMDRDDLLGDLVEMLRADISEAYNDDGSVKPIKEWPRGLRMRVHGMDVQKLDQDGLEAVITKIKWTDPHKTAEMIGKHVDIQAFKDQVKHEGLTLEDLLAGGGKGENA